MGAGAGVGVVAVGLVAVGVDVAVGVAVGVDVAVGAAVGVDVVVGVGVAVDGAVGVGVPVGVAPAGAAAAATSPSAAIVARRVLSPRRERFWPDIRTSSLKRSSAAVRGSNAWWAVCGCSDRRPRPCQDTRTRSNSIACCGLRVGRGTPATASTAPGRIAEPAAAATIQDGSALWWRLAGPKSSRIRTA